MLLQEEVAELLSVEEGRRVTVAEVKKIEAQALRKLRQVLFRRGMKLDDLFIGASTISIMARVEISGGRKLEGHSEICEEVRRKAKEMLSPWSFNLGPKS